MKTHIGITPAGCFFLCSMLLGLISCTETPPEKSGITMYGTPVSYLQQAQITFPDFSMRYLGDPTAHNANKIAHDVDLNHQFEITAGSETVSVTWGDYDNTKRYERFNIGNNFYYLKIKSSYFQNRALPPGTLVILNFIQFQENTPPAFKAGTSKEAAALASHYFNYRKALQGGDWSLIKIFLSSNRKEILNYSKKKAHITAQGIADNIAFAAQKTKALELQKAIFSPAEAKAHFTAHSSKSAQIIGVSFVKEGEDWKIESETVTADDEVGKQWVKLFLKPE